MAPRLGITAETYRRYAAEGYSQSETARLLGVKPQTVKKVAEKHGLTFAKGYKSKEKRDAEKARTAAADQRHHAATPEAKDAARPDRQD